MICLTYFIKPEFLQHKKWYAHEKYFRTFDLSDLSVAFSQVE